MKNTPAWVYTVETISADRFDCQLYIDGEYRYLRVNDQVINGGKKFNIIGFYDPNNITSDETNSAFGDGWVAKLKPVINGTQPTIDSGWNSSVETPAHLIPDYDPDVAWGCVIYNVLSSFKPYTFELDLSVENYDDPGAGQGQAGDYLVDFDGNLYKVIAFSGMHATVEEVIPKNIAPVSERMGYVYRPEAGAPILTQAKLQWLDATARDKVNNIEKAVIWKNRGVSLTSADGAFENVTKIEVEGLTVVDTNESGWNGGHSIKIQNQHSTADFGTF